MGILKEKLLDFEVFFMLGRPFSAKYKPFLSFFLPFLLCLTIFTGTASVGLYTPAPQQITPQNHSSTAAMRGLVSVTLLLGVGDTPAQAQYFTLDIKTQLQSAFLEELPANAVHLHNRKDTVGGHAAHSGMQTAKQAAAQLSGNPVARYVWLTPQTLAAIVDAIGGVVLTDALQNRRYAGAEFAELLRQGDPRVPLCRLLQQFFADEGSFSAGATLLFAAADTDLSAPDLQDNKSALLGLTVY